MRKKCSRLRNILAFLRCRDFCVGVFLFTLSVGVIQTTERPCLVLRLRGMPVTVHPGGSSTLARVQTATPGRSMQHGNSVLTHVSLTPTAMAFLWIGKIATTCGVTCTATRILPVIGTIPQHCSKSSDGVIQVQIRDVIVAFAQNCLAETLNRI